MTVLTERLRASVTYQYMPMNVRKMLSEAATTLETLTQENARLREALGDIMALDTTDVHVGYDWGSGGGNYVYGDHILADDAFAIARKALGGGDE